MSNIITKTIVKPTTLHLTMLGQQITDLSYAKFNVGDVVTVKWNNVKYDCTVRGMDPGHAFIGNNTLYGNPEFGELINTGEPFFILRMRPYTWIFARKLGDITLEITTQVDADLLETEFNDNLPEDFPRFNISGKSVSTADMLITPYTGDFTSGYIFITDYQGQIKWYKQTPSFCYNFKQHINPKGEIRYSYMVTEKPYGGQYDLCYGVLMNENMEVIKNNIRMLAAGTSKDGDPLECHTFTYLDDKHYIMSAVDQIIVTNIPGYEMTKIGVFNNIIQEQKNEEVVWHIETIDYPELYSASVYNNNFEICSDGINYSDYAHINAISKDIDGNILVSFRNIGLVKFNYISKEIMWIIGRGRNDINNMEFNNIPYLQHDVRYLQDGSFTIFDNWGCPENYTRICRYWIDDATKIVNKIEILNTLHQRSMALGYSELIDNASNIYNITYGMCKNAPALEEYDFTNNAINMTLSFKDQYQLYNISRAIQNYDGQAN